MKPKGISLFEKVSIQEVWSFDHDFLSSLISSHYCNDI